MRLNKKRAFLALLAMVVVLCLLYQFIWIFSRTTTARVTGTDSYRSRRGRIYLIDGTYKVGSEIYNGFYLDNGFDRDNPFFEIRYLIFAPDISRSNNFMSNWGVELTFLAIIFLISSILFIRKDIISDGAIFIIQRRRPFLRIEHNEIEDYDEHTVDEDQMAGNGKIGQAEQALKEKLRVRQSLTAEYEIKASVYKLNPNAILIFIFYIFYLLWFFHAILFSRFGSFEILIAGGILFFIPIYVQNTNNKTFKAKVLNENSLVFSTNGILFKDFFYSYTDIEAAVVYLDSFEGFEYRDRTTIGKANEVSAGDNNKISYRFGREIIDLTFYLASCGDYFDFKNLMAEWSSKGVNILLQKVFEDDFVVQEMVYFNTASHLA